MSSRPLKPNHHRPTSLQKQQALGAQAGPHLHIRSLGEVSGLLLGLDSPGLQFMRSEFRNGEGEQTERRPQCRRWTQLGAEQPSSASEGSEEGKGVGPLVPRPKGGSPANGLGGNRLVALGLDLPLRSSCPALSPSQKDCHSAGGWVGVVGVGTAEGDLAVERELARL